MVRGEQQRQVWLEDGTGIRNDVEGGRNTARRTGRPPRPSSGDSDGDSGGTRRQRHDIVVAVAVAAVVSSAAGRLWSRRTSRKGGQDAFVNA